jgi:hypothetical protein
VFTIYFCQTKEITLEDIWQKYVFYPTGSTRFHLHGPQGDFYTVKTRTKSLPIVFKPAIRKTPYYSTADLKNASNNTIGICDIQLYQLDNSEQHMLIGNALRKYLPSVVQKAFIMYNLSKET